MAVKIISLKDGFRRCGVEHPTKPVVHPDDAFNKKQLKALQAEPMLIVEIIPEQKAPDKDKDPNNNQDKK